MYSALEALVGLAVVEQVADAVYGVLEDRGGGEHDHADRGINERDDVEGGHETGDLADETEVFECFHGDRGWVSTAGGRCGGELVCGPTRSVLPVVHANDLSKRRWPKSALPGR